ncbi:uncharacterized protein LOC135118328 [Helicoverpa armigera]|uniref:uncharacterized protein LOC135118328 n=1 Tax=Helicoverpa armigera TaxID=29058 RepID=UPI003083BA41
MKNSEKWKNYLIWKESDAPFIYNDIQTRKSPIDQIDDVSIGMHAIPETTTGGCQAGDCPNKFCNKESQYDKTDAKQARKRKPIRKASPRSKAVGSLKCLCNASAQSSATRGAQLCTCATQHSATDLDITTTAVMVSSGNFYGMSDSKTRMANKKIQHRQMAHKDSDTNVLIDRSEKLSLEKQCVKTKSYLLYPDPNPFFTLDGTQVYLIIINSSRCGLAAVRECNLSIYLKRDLFTASDTVEDAIEDSYMLTETITDDTSYGSISYRSDETKTDTTICSLAAVDYDDSPRRRKFRVKVVTKTNQATLTDKTRLCDTGTITNDWWSPLVERRGNDEILLEKKQGYNTIEKKDLKDTKELKESKELKEVKRKRKNCGVTTDGRIVTFRSRTQIIPAGLLPGMNDIMSPSRYLLESQKYYNELFAYNFRIPQGDYFAQMPKYQDREKARSPLGSRRNHHRKTKRLDECYSPRRQVSPRKRHTESTKTSDSPRRRPYAHCYSNRHYVKYNSPRKLI